MPLKQKVSIALIFSIFAILIIGITSSYLICQPLRGNVRGNLLGCQSLFPTILTTPTPNISKIIAVTNTTLQEETNEQYLVTRIIDGDTFEIETRQKVRLIGIDTPELNKANARDPECFGVQATQKLSDLILNKKIRMKKDISETDRFGRLLRYIYIDTLFVNKYLVDSGFAFAHAYPPDMKFKDTLTLAQKTAQENKQGLWNECSY